MGSVLRPLLSFTGLKHQFPQMLEVQTAARSWLGLSPQILLVFKKPPFPRPDLHNLRHLRGVLGAKLALDKYIERLKGIDHPLEVYI